MKNTGFAEKIRQINPILKNWSRLCWLVYFLFIPVFLLVLFILPDSIKQYLVLQSNNPSLLSVFFNHYTHINFIHVLNNIFIYLITSFLIFNIETNKKRFFLVTLLFFLFLPFIVSFILLLLIPSNFYMLGFSAINASFIGYLIFSVYNFLKDQYDFIKISFGVLH